MKSKKLDINNWSYRSLLSILFILLIAVVILARFIFPNQKVSAAWWNEGWGYRKAIAITNTLGSVLTNQRVKITIDTSALITAGKLQSNCNDLRITDINGNILDHWDTNCNNASTNIYVKLPAIPPSGTSINIYYGNPSAPNIEKTLGTSDNPGTSCQMMKDQGSVTANGIFYIVPGGADIDKQLVYCDQTTDGGGWTLVMNQNVSTGGFFANSTEAQSFNEANPNAGRYSILGKLAKFKDNGIFTFKLNWPGLSSSRNIWSQTSNPISDTIAGYTPITIDQTVNYWGGIAPAGGSTFIDGSPADGTWYYAIASYSIWSCGIPAYSPCANQTQLWVKGNNTMNNVSIGTPATEEISPAPIAYWKFDEGNGTSFLDSTINKNNGNFGTGNSAPFWATEDQCISGKCLKFSGSNYSTYTSNVVKTVNIRTQGITYSAWVKPTITSGTYRIVGQKPSSGYSDFASGGLGISASKAQMIAYDDNVAYKYATGNTTLNPNQWYYITGSYDPADQKIKIYVNGKLDGTSVSMVTFSRLETNASNTIGYQDNGSNYFYSGFLDEVKIFPYARTPAQIKSDYSTGLAHSSSSKGISASLGSSNKSGDFLSNGLVGYWKMDENIGTTTLDSSGNNKTGTFGIGDSAPIWSTGKFGVGLSFDGSNDYINFGDPGLSSLATTTISFWRKASNTNAWLLFQGQDSNYYVMATSGSGAFYHNNIGSATKTIYIDGKVATAPLTDTNWHHYVITGVNLSTWTNLRLSNYPNYQYNGLIDEVRIYNRALSPSEVSSLYNWAPGPVGYWDFEENTGVVAKDKSGNNYNTTLSSINWTTGKYGAGAKFNGSSTASIINIDNRVRNSENITLTGWYYHNADTGGAPWSIMTNTAAPNADGFWWHIKYPGNILYLRTEDNVYGESDGTGTPFVSSGKWYYITTIIGTNKFDVYVNGTLYWSWIPNANFSWSNINSDTLYLYLGSSYGTYIDGSLDDVKLYNYARSPKQITEDMLGGHSTVSNSGPIAYYKFDEGFGTTTNNIGSGGSYLNGIFGTGNSAPTWTNDGKFNKALIFDGIDDFVKIPQSPQINSLTQFTFSFWVKHDGTNIDNYIFYKGTASPSLTVNFNGNTIGQEYWTTGGVRTSATTISNVSPNQWHQVVFTFKENDIAKAYLDGKLIQTNSIPNSIRTNTEDLYFNTYGGTAGSYNVKGIFDEVKIYNSALTAEEIKLDYNRGASLQLGSLSASTGSSAPPTASSQQYCVPGDSSICSAPVAEWNFEENSGTTTSDSSGNNNTGTLGTGNSAPTWTVGKKSTGAGLNFNGNQFVTINDSSLLKPTAAITAQTWFNIPNKAATQTIFSKTEGSGYNLALNTGAPCQSSSICFLININGTYYAASYPVSNISNNIWYQATGVYDGTSVKLFLNGSSVGTTSTVISTITQGPYNLCIGSESNAGNCSNGGSFFSGKVDQFQIYNYARTPAQIAFDYNRGGPIGWWKLDECQGSVANDSSGMGNIGSISIGAAGSQTSPGTCSNNLATSAWNNGKTSKYNSSLNFDGTDDYISTSQSSNDPYFTWSVWLKPTNVSADQMFFGPSASVSSAYYFRISGSKPFISIPAGSQQTLSGNTILQNNKWYHLVGSYDGAYLYIYVNGILDKKSSLINVPLSTPWGVGRIGRWTDGDQRPFTGQIDDIRTYNYSLTSEQVKTLYNNGAVSFSN